MSVIIRGKGPREGFPDFVVKKLKGDRYGVLTGTVERHWKIGPQGKRIDQKWVSTLHAPDPGWGIPCVDADGQVKDGQFITSYTYEGSNTPTTYAPTDDQKTFELDGNMGDRKIQLHPRFAELKAQFGWDDQTRQFEEFMPGEFTGATPFTKTAAQGTRSPLAAVESWLYVGLSYRISYAAQSVPSALLAKIGTLIKAPPNIGKFKLPEAAQKRRWLVMAPKASIRGNTAQITEEYLLSEPGGLPDAIYGFGQLS